MTCCPAVSWAWSTSTCQAGQRHRRRVHVIDVDRFGSQHIGWDRDVLSRGTVVDEGRVSPDRQRSPKRTGHYRKRPPMISNSSTTPPTAPASKRCNLLGGRQLLFRYNYSYRVSGANDSARCRFLSYNNSIGSSSMGHIRLYNDVKQAQSM
jgi:hypothetical protein